MKLMLPNQIVRKLAAVLFLLLTHYSFAQGTIPFITTWTTTNGKIKIPTLAASGTYNYSVKWINLTSPGVNEGVTNNITGDYEITGLYDNHTYQIEILGDFPHFYMNNNNTYRTTLHSIEQWGNVEWHSFENAFTGCSNLQINATDFPNLSNVTNMSGMFQSCFIFTGNASMNSWDTSHITNMSNLFNNAKVFNQNIGNWNTSAVTNMAEMFAYTDDFNQDISNWNISNVTNMGGMFISADDFNQNLSNWNISSVTNLGGMFFDALSFNQNIGSWNTSQVTNMGWMFYGASAFNQNIGNWNLNSIPDNSMDAMDSMLSNTGLDCENYSSTLIGWAGNTNTPNGITFAASGRKYNSQGQTARNTLINTKGWTITDAGYDPNCPATVSVPDELLIDLDFYPNPIINYVESTEVISSVMIYDLKGVLIQSLKPNSTKIDVSSLASGMYLLKGSVGTYYFIERIIKQ